MIRRMYKRLTRFKTKWWLITGSLLGVGMLPCPECGTPLIFHVWPIAGLVLVARMMRKRYQEKEQVGSETASAEPGIRVSANHHDDRCD